MKVGELAAELAALPPDLDVVIAKDEEGNAFHAFVYFEPLYMESEDDFTYEMVEDEETGEWKTTPANVVVLWP